MPKIIVTTDQGREVWSADAGASATRHLEAPLSGGGSSLAAGLRRAVEDAEAIQGGRDPERPSERAMRLSKGGTT